MTVLFALLFKELPDVKIAWRDVWLGAAITTVLFLIGRFLIGEYACEPPVLLAEALGHPVVGHDFDVILVRADADVCGAR
jgi:hypothetical protein